jgi:hypothetical protein
MSGENIIYIVNIATDKKPGRSEPYVYGINSWKKWADKNGCRLVTLTDPILPYEKMRPNWHKIFIFDLLKESQIKYENILIVDADTIVHPKAPNLFEVAENKMAVVNNIGSFDWMLRSVENYKKYVFNDFNFDITKYFNSGMMLVNKSHEEFFTKIKSFYFENKDLLVKMQETFGTGTDQPVLNFMTQIEKIDMKFLPYTYNMQELYAREGLDDNMSYIDMGHIFHFNGIPNNPVSVSRWMEKTYNKLYDKKYL